MSTHPLPPRRSSITQPTSILRRPGEFVSPHPPLPPSQQGYPHPYPQPHMYRPSIQFTHPGPPQSQPPQPPQPYTHAHFSSYNHPLPLDSPPQQHQYQPAAHYQHQYTPQQAWQQSLPSPPFQPPPPSHAAPPPRPQFYCQPQPQPPGLYNPPPPPILQPKPQRLVQPPPRVLSDSPSESSHSHADQHYRQQEFNRAPPPPFQPAQAQVQTQQPPSQPQWRPQSQPRPAYHRSHPEAARAPSHSHAPAPHLASGQRRPEILDFASSSHLSELQAQQVPQVPQVPHAQQVPHTQQVPRRQVSYQRVASHPRPSAQDRDLDLLQATSRSSHEQHQGAAPAPPPKPAPQAQPQLQAQNPPQTQTVSRAALDPLHDFSDTRPDISPTMTEHPVPPPPRTHSASALTLPPGAEPATRPALPRPSASGLHGTHTQAVPYNPSAALGPPRGPSPSPGGYDRAAAFGPSRGPSPAPSQTSSYDHAAGAGPPARYNLAAAFGPSKGPMRTPSARYNAAAAFGPPKSDSGHSLASASGSGESGRRYAAAGARSDAGKAATPAPAAAPSSGGSGAGPQRTQQAVQIPAPAPTAPPAQTYAPAPLPPGASAFIQPQGRSAAAPPTAGRVHQFNSAPSASVPQPEPLAATPVTIPRPGQPSSVYATPMSTPPVRGPPEPTQVPAAPRLRTTPPPVPTQTPAKTAGATGLSSPPESPPQQSQTQQAKPQTPKKQAQPQSPPTSPPKESFVVRRGTRSNNPAIPVRQPVGTTPSAVTPQGPAVTPQAPGVPSPPKRVPDSRSLSPTGSFTKLRGTRNPGSPPATPLTAPRILPDTPSPAVRPQPSGASLRRMRSLSPTTPPKEPSPLPASTGPGANLTLTAKPSFVVNRRPRSPAQTAISVATPQRPPVAQPQQQQGSSTPPSPQRLAARQPNTASAPSLRAPSQRRGTLSQSGSSTSLRVPEPLPTPAPSKQPSKASLRVPRDREARTASKQASAASLRTRTESQRSPSRGPSGTSHAGRSTHSARSVPPSPRPPMYEPSTDSSLDGPLTPPETPPRTPPRTPTPRLVLSTGARVWRLENVRQRVVDILVKDRRFEPLSPAVLFPLMRVNRASFCSVVAALYADVSYTCLPLKYPVPAHRMSVYRTAVRKLDLSGCLPASRGHGFFDLFDAFVHLESVTCGKVEMLRPRDYTPLDIRVTRRLPMRADGIFYTINPFEPCLPRGHDARVSYALEFGGMPRAGALRFAEGQKHATVPPVLCRAVHSLATDESHSARAWLNILARRAHDGFPHPARLLLSQAEPVSLGEFAAFAATASGIEELRLAVDLTNPAVTPTEFFDTVDWAAFAALKKLHIALFVPPPPRAEEHFSTRIRLESAPTIVTISTVEEEPPSPATAGEAVPNEPLSVRERVSRPVSGLFKGIGVLSKLKPGFMKAEKVPEKLVHDRPDLRVRVDSEPGRRPDSTVSRAALSPRPMSEFRRPPSVLDPDFGVWPSESEPTVAFPPQRAAPPPPDLPLAELRLTLAVHVPEWASYDVGGDDWGYIRASVPHPARLARALLRFGATCGVHITVHTTTPVDGVGEISEDYDLRVVGRVADAYGRYGPFGSDAERAMYID